MTAFIQRSYLGLVKLKTFGEIKILISTDTAYHNRDTI